jgi:uncharacterized damage-inducible protein DinB
MIPVPHSQELYMRRITAGVLASLCSVVVLGAVDDQTRSGGGNEIAASLRKAWTSAKTNLVQSAEVMPEANYAFKPVDSVRSYGAILAHVAGANYVFCAAALGQKPPHAEDEFEKSATTRAAIVKALGDSMAYCDKAFEAATDRSLAEAIEMPFGMGKDTRASALMGNVGHLNEHYGNLVTYMRMKGVVPPTSRR